jgi:hypothetical protein
VARKPSAGGHAEVVAFEDGAQRGQQRRRPGQLPGLVGGGENLAEAARKVRSAASARARPSSVSTRMAERRSSGLGRRTTQPRFSRRSMLLLIVPTPTA